MDGATSSRTPQRVTAADVAQAAGVSRATVSYVLNDTPTQKVSAPTRALVLEAAERLGYAPSPAARMLRTGSSDLVLITTQPMPASLAYATFIDALVTELRGHGFSPLIHFDESGDVDALLQTCGQLELAGFLDLSSLLASPTASRRLAATGTRGVVAFSPDPLLTASTTPGARVIHADLRVPGQLAVEHLVHRGYRSILGLAPSDPALGFMAALRMEGGRLAADAAGVDYAEAAGAGLTAAAIGSFVDDLAARRTVRGGPDAVFAYNDDYALLLVHCLLDRGFAVPDDIAVIGCDNAPAGELVHPQLSTVDLGHAAVATFVADLLHGEIAGTPLPADATPPAPVVVARAST